MVERRTKVEILSHDSDCLSRSWSVFFVMWIYRKPRSEWATVQLHSGRERRRLFPQMVPAAHTCHHLWPWHMAGSWAPSCVIACLFKMKGNDLWFVVAERLVSVSWRWDVVSGRSSWSMSSQGWPLLNQFLYLLSECTSLLPHTFGT